MKTLHPTKGYRTISLKRSRAAVLVSSILNGGSADLVQMKKFIQGS